MASLLSPTFVCVRMAAYYYGLEFANIHLAI
jgi:hypothetical protein